MINRVLALPLAAGLWLAASCAPVASAAENATLIVAAASSLRLAVSEIASVYRQKTGQQVKLSFGSTGNLVRQIEEGAPFTQFLAADEASAERLVQNGKASGPAQVLVQGRLALAIAKDRTIETDAQLQGIKRALGNGSIRAFAIANPKLAPYGKAAEQALQRAGLWDGLNGHIVMAENVGQAVQFVASGAADAALVAEALLKAPAVSSSVRHVPVDTSLYDPVRQSMVLLNSAGQQARAFHAFLRSEDARSIFAKYGFDVPDL